jgi:hypothetical protein
MQEERIVNGGFESEIYGEGWTPVGSADCLFLIWPIWIHSGVLSCVIVSFEGSPMLTQEVNFTNVNNLSFWYDHYGMGFFVAIDETVIETYGETWEWTQSTIDVSEYSGVHTLTFGLTFGSEDGDIYVFLDDISAIADVKYWYENGIGVNYIGRGRLGGKGCKVM